MQDQFKDQEAALDAFGAHYGYDVTYMRRMLHAAPDAFAKFYRIAEITAHREAAPLEAWYAAKIAGALKEDCGPCVQLVVDMAQEAGVDPAEIEAVLTRDVTAMSEDTALGFLFADAVLRADPDEDDIRDAVTARWGAAGLVDLALGMQVGRIFPMMKAALGYAKTCQRVAIGERRVDVVKTAA